MSTDHREAIVQQIGRRRLAATIRTDDKDSAAGAMRAAVRGGFRMIEFTLTTPGAMDLIAEFRRQEELLVGAGTVLTTDQAREAVSAGAQFLVSPVFDAEVVAVARELGVPSIPGTASPTEMLAAHRAGADLVKLFPGPANVAEYVSAVLGPLPFLKIFPTHGTTPENFLGILQAGAYGVAFVKSLFDPKDMKRRNFGAIERRAAEIVKQLGVRA